MLAQQLSEAKPPEKTPLKKRLPAFIFTESIQEVVKRQDGSMSRGIITISSIEPSWLNHGRRYSGPRTSPTHPLIWVHRSCFPQDSDRSLFLYRSLFANGTKIPSPEDPFLFFEAS